MDKYNKEKLIANLDKGTVVSLTLNDGTSIVGIVERNVLCCEENNDWHELIVYVAGNHLSVNSKDIMRVNKCASSSEDEHDTIIGKDGFEIYNIPYGLKDVEFIKSVLDVWEDLEDDARNEIADIIAPSLTADMLKDIFGAYAVVEKENNRLHKEVLKLLDDLTEEVDKKKEKSTESMIPNALATISMLGLATSVLLKDEK